MDKNSLYYRLFNTHNIEDTNSFKLYKTAKSETNFAKCL